MPIDSEELGVLLDRYWATLVQWVGGAREGAEDIVQSAFIKLASEEPPPSNCAAWLFTVSKRLAINDQLSRTKRRLRESLAGSHGAESTDFDSGLEMRELLSQLEDREREVVIARVWGELTFDEIATACGDSKSTIWRLYQSGISKLRIVYGELADE